MSVCVCVCVSECVAHVHARTHASPARRPPDTQGALAGGRACERGCIGPGSHPEVTFTRGVCVRRQPVGFFFFVDPGTVSHVRMCTCLGPARRPPDMYTYVHGSSACQNVCVKRLCQAFLSSICVKHLCQAFVSSVCVKRLCQTFVSSVCVKRLCQAFFCSPHARMSLFL